jgi:hypothetical protein
MCATNVRAPPLLWYIRSAVLVASGDDNDGGARLRGRFVVSRRIRVARAPPRRASASSDHPQTLRGVQAWGPERLGRYKSAAVTVRFLRHYFSPKEVFVRNVKEVF